MLSFFAVKKKNTKLNFLVHYFPNILIHQILFYWPNIYIIFNLLIIKKALAGKRKTSKHLIIVSSIDENFVPFD